MKVVALISAGAALVVALINILAGDKIEGLLFLIVGGVAILLSEDR
jgi:hypothetical protein